MDTTLPKLLTAKQAAQVLGLAPATLRYWRCRRPLTFLPFIRVGGRVMYDAADIARFLEKYRVGGHL